MSYHPATFHLSTGDVEAMTPPHLTGLIVREASDVWIPAAALDSGELLAHSLGWRGHGRRERRALQR